jgi:hypothetical protein
MKKNKSDIPKYIGYGFSTLGYIILLDLVSYFIYWFIFSVIGLKNNIVISSIVFGILLINYVFFLVLLRRYLVKYIKKVKTLVTISCSILIIYAVANLIKLVIKPFNCDGLDLLPNNWGYVFCRIGYQLNKDIYIFSIFIFAFTIIAFIIIDLICRKK